MTRCRACDAEIEFVLFGSTRGSRMPFDVGVHEDGEWEEIGQHGFAPIVRHVPAEARVGRLLRRAHWATCTEPDRFRRRRRG